MASSNLWKCCETWRQQLQNIVEDFGKNYDDDDDDYDDDDDDEDGPLVMIVMMIVMIMIVVMMMIQNKSKNQIVHGSFQDLFGLS